MLYVKFEKHISGESILPADLRSPCYCAVLRDADEPTFERFLELYRAADLHEEQDRICDALAASKDPLLLKRVLEFAISDEVRAQDKVFMITSVAWSRYGRDLAWQFSKDHWQELIDRYQGSPALVGLVKSLIHSSVSDAAAEELEEFFRTHPVPGTERSVQQALEAVRLSAAWRARDQDRVAEYLQALVAQQISNP